MRRYRRICTLLVDCESHGLLPGPPLRKFVHGLVPLKADIDLAPQRSFPSSPDRRFSRRFSPWPSPPPPSQPSPLLPPPPRRLFPRMQPPPVSSSSDLSPAPASPLSTRSHG